MRYNHTRPLVFLVLLMRDHLFLEEKEELQTLLAFEFKKNKISAKSSNHQKYALFRITQKNFRTQLIDKHC